MKASPSTFNNGYVSKQTAHSGENLEKVDASNLAKLHAIITTMHCMLCDM